MKLIRNRILLKAFAVFFLLEILTSTVVPAVSWALTSGPITPELMTFAPIGGGTSVDKFTGGVGYQIPLLEVGSPEGGYPLSLSYQAGIKPGQEASFCGLGWNLSIGGISRVASGHPDDYAGADLAVHDTWEGGNMYKEGAGLDLNFVGLWLEGNWSTHTAKTVDAAMNLSIKGNGLYINTGTGSVGASYNGLGVDIDKNNNVAVSYSGSFGGGSNEAEESDKPLVTVSAQYASGQNSQPIGMQPFNNTANNIQTQRVAHKDYFVYKYEKTRYWLDETDDSKVYGALQMQYLPSTIPTNYAFDRSVSGEIAYNPVFENDPKVVRENNEFLAGPSTPAFDQYNVTAHGLTGNIEPVILGNPTLFDRDKLNVSLWWGKMDILYNRHERAAKRAYFRFKNDFSNSHRVNLVRDYQLGTTPTGEGKATIDFGQEGYGYTRLVNSEGFDDQTEELAGSSRIQYFENREISDGTTAKGKKFINYVRPINRNTVTSARSRSSYDVSRQIGGYSVTNSSGVTYHYALPVYTYENVQNYQKPDDAGKISAREVINNQPYAYVWMLTAITGSDFVDRNNNGVADKEDWGYWMNFVYGHSGNYKYRLPAEANSYVMGSDGSKTYSYGMRDMYYIDAIYSRTQTCFFVKDIRNDGKGVSSLKNGGFGVTDEGGSIGRTASAPSYKLNSVVLMTNKDVSDPLQEINQAGNIMATDRAFGDLIMNNSNFMTYDDAASFLTGKEERILKEINFDYDYSLCPRTANNVWIDYDQKYGQGQGEAGKLTLWALDIKGANRTSYIPRYMFWYDRDSDDVLKFSGLTTNQTGGRSLLVNMVSSPPAVGDLYTFTYEGNNYFGVVASARLVDMWYSVMLMNVGIRDYPTANLGAVSFKSTENPPYNPELYDWWGYYKSDYIRDPAAKSDNDLYRRTSALSAKSTHVWSMRRVRNPMGEEFSLEYESNDYLAENVGVGTASILNVSNNTGALFEGNSTEYILQQHNNFYGSPIQYLKLYIVEKELLNLLVSSSALRVGADVDVVSYSEQYKEGGGVLNKIQINGADYVKPLVGKVRIEAIGTDYIKISDPNHVYTNFSNENGSAKGHLHFYSFIKIPQQTIYGDGIRVKAVNSNNMLGNTKRIVYEFSGGRTVSEPSMYSSLCKNKYFYEWTNGPQPDANDVELYEKEYQRSYNGLNRIVDLLPAPGVHYNVCTVKTYSDGVLADSYMEYGFNGFDANMIQATTSDPEYQYSSLALQGGGGYHESRTLRVKDLTSRMGAPWYVNTMSSKNNNRLATQRFSYAFYDHNYEGYDYQGVLEQVYNEHRTIHQQTSGKDVQMATVSILSRYAPLLLGSEYTDYVKGLTTSINNGYDFYSGQVTRQTYTNSLGDVYASEITPAYKVYSAMGLAMKGGKNMLLQEASRYVYKLDAENERAGLVSAKVQTWSDRVPAIVPLSGTSGSLQLGVWRPSASFSFVGSDAVPVPSNGLYPMGNLTPFTAWTWNKDNAVPDGWQLGSAITQYDVFSHAREAVDMNKTPSAVRLDATQTRVIATASNAAYLELASSGFENVTIGTGDGGFTFGEAGAVTSYAHTGKGSMLFMPGEKGLNSLIFNTQKVDPDFSQGVGSGKLRNYDRKLHVSFWANPEHSATKLTLFYQTMSETRSYPVDFSKLQRAGGDDWYLFEMDVDVPVNSTTGEVDVLSRFYLQHTGTGGNLYIDDFRIHPLDAAVTSYVYDDSGNLEYILGSNNMYTKYTYGNEGHVIETWVETFLPQTSGSVRVSEVKYRHKDSQD